MNLCYPADLRKYGRGTVGLFFPDVPEAVTVGKTMTEVLHHAADALVVALSAYVDDGRPVLPLNSLRSPPPGVRSGAKLHKMHCAWFGRVQSGGFKHRIAVRRRAVQTSRPD